MIDYYNAVEKDFDTVDNKAQSLIAYFGAGTSVLVIGVVLAISEHKVTKEVGWAFVPSILFGLIANGRAVYARRPYTLKHAPTLEECERYIAYYLEQKNANGEYTYTDTEATKMAEYFSIVQWYESAVHNCKVVEDKSHWYNKAMWALVGSVACLVIPYIAALCK